MTGKRYNELLVRTPEGVEFVYLLASPVVRCLALFVDFAVIWALMSLVSSVVTLMQWVAYDFAIAFYTLLYFIISIGYFIVLEIVWRGQTIGKRMFRLRVLDANGLKLEASQLAMRNLLRFVDSFPFLYTVGGLFALFHPKFQRLGDLGAGTIVVRVTERQQPLLSELDDKRYNSFKDFPRAEAMLRQKVSPEHAEIALQALRLRDGMDATERAGLYRELADSFRDEVAFPEEITRSLSDEQYLRNCIDTLYRNSKK